MTPGSAPKQKLRIAAIPSLMNLQLSNLLLNRIRAVYEQLQLPLPAALRRLRATGWTPVSDALAFLRDAGGEPLAPAVRSFVGMRVIDDWYQQAGGYALCQQAMHVLRLHVHQGSFGQSVRGEGAGQFALLDLDETHGIGHVRSSTPFCREWERGLIQGSLDAPGDLLYSDVRWIEAQQRFELRFVSDANRERVAWALGEPEDARVWRLRDRVRRLEQANAYLEARPAAAAALPRRASSDWLDPLTGAASEAHLVERLRQTAQEALPPQLCLLVCGLSARQADAESMRTLGAAALRLTRGADLLARVGEDRLALLLHDVDEQAGERVAQRLREGLPPQLADALELRLHPWRGTPIGALIASLRAR